MLSKMLGLPYVALGDFNITWQEFLESDWPTILDVEVLRPNAVTTTSVSADRAIDFGLISKSISKFFMSARPIYSVPWGPHYGAIYDFLMNPKSVKGQVVCVCLRHSP